ncbi:MAG: hypothetical protein KAV87_29470 [Desulfobacteraceae bacterium]|nr:hypothetical protein [Desulfobacteraceae bacterium]
MKQQRAITSRQALTTTQLPSNVLPRAAVPTTAEHRTLDNVHQEGYASGMGQDFSQLPIHSQMPHACFPYQTLIEPALGIPIVGRAVLAPIECARRGTPAFTEYSTTYFASEQPRLEVAAHEATHLAQHAKITRDANLGAEGHAEMISRHVAAGLSAHRLISPNGSTVEPAYHPYTEISTSSQTVHRWNAGLDLRVSEDGRMAVGQDLAMHNFWAEPAKINESNSILNNRRSVIRLREQSNRITGPAPDGGPVRTLSKVLPENVANATTGENMNIWADCGMSGRDVMGAGEGTGGHYSRMTAVYKENPWWASIPILGPLFSWIFGIDEETTTSGPEAMKMEIFNERLGGTGDEGYRRYLAFSPVEREEFDRETGINRYAAPTTGEGYTVSTGGNPIHPPGDFTWNFHWGGVVMDSGEDRTTLENYAVGDPTVQNSDWEFQMYGSAARSGQTFHEQHRATRQHGDAPTTMRVRVR